MKPVQYNFVSTFVISAPKEAVWGQELQFEQWSTWWRAIRSLVIEQTTPPQIFTMTVGTLLYALTFTLTVKNIDADKGIIEVDATGDLSGTGKFILTEVPTGTQLSFIWNVVTTKLWMNALAPLLKPIFIFSHHIVMHQFGKGLARQVHGAVIQENHI